MRKVPLIALTFLAATAADACTTVVDVDPQRPIVAYNYDFPIGQGIVLVNKRRVEKTSGAGQGAARWQSRYGSVTFVQFGRDNPMTGMNEAGLVVSQMWLDEARYEQPDARPSVGVLEWMQYLLDTASSVEEALALAAEVRIQSSVPLHYALVDVGGRAAFVEFLDGKRVVHTGAGLTHTALANSAYSESLSYVAELRGTDAPTGPQSLARFARAATRSATEGSADPVERAFETLRTVSQLEQTRWSIVYDPANLVVRWRSKDNDAVRAADLKRFDLSCKTPVQLLDVHAGEGDVSARFRDYSSLDNENLVLSSYAQTPFLAVLGRQAALASARVPDVSRCVE
jgi:penicillin V acylase-like amidase (Ntn superfamily)